MFLASIRVELSIPHAGSLKDKRQALASLMDRIRSRFGAAVAEVADQELWQRAVVGVALVSGEQGHVRELADKVAAFIDAHWQGEVCRTEIDLW